MLLFVLIAIKTVTLKKKFRKTKLHKKFTEVYKQIKEYCEKYNKDSESEYVSGFFDNYSYFKSLMDDIIILDIEASVDSLNDGQELLV